MPIFDVLRPIWSKNRFSLFCNNVIATFCYSNLKAEAAAENDDDKAAKDCLCDDDGGNVDCHKIPLVSRFIVSFAFCLWVSLIQLIFSRFEHHLLLLFLLFRLEVQQTMPYQKKGRYSFYVCTYDENTSFCASIEDRPIIGDCCTLGHFLPRLIIIVQKGPNAGQNMQSTQRRWSKANVNQ